MIPVHGLCVDSPQPLWDGTREGESKADREERQRIAKWICGQCTAQDACRATYDPRRDEGVRFGQVLPEVKKAPVLDPELFRVHGNAEAARNHRRRGEVPCGPCQRASEVFRRPYPERRAS